MFFFSSPSSMSQPALLVDLNFLPSRRWGQPCRAPEGPCCRLLQEERRRHPQQCSLQSCSEYPSCSLFLHVINILLEAGQLIAVLLEADRQTWKTGRGGALQSAQGGCAPSLEHSPMAVLLPQNICSHFKSLLDNVPLDHSENPLLPDHLTRDV